MRWVLLMLAVALSALPGACSSASPGGQAPIRDHAASLLEKWSGEIAPVFQKLAERRQAERDGDTTRAAVLGQDVLQAMRPLEKFGADARALFVDDPETPLKQAVIRAGDAFAEWAYTLRIDPPRGDFKKARHLADLGASALASYRVALREAGINPDQ